MVDGGGVNGFDDSEFIDDLGGVGEELADPAAGFAVLRDQLKPEKSNTFEAGFRFGQGSVRGVVSAYLVNFSNRILAIPQGPGIVGNAPIQSNVGDVRSLGAELGLTWQPVKAVTITASYAYNENTYQDDVVNAAGVVVQAIRGRTVVDSPRHIGNLEIAYDDGNFYGRANANAMTKRFFTFSNDQSVGGRVVVDGKIGYRITSDNRWLNGLAIEGTVTNLLDKRYIATIGSNGFGFAGDNQTLLPAPPRQFFATLRKDF
jgi:iron complex outermembrane receptor protein